MRIDIPELCLVVLMGASGSGKSTFAKTHFLPTEVISSDHCRALVCDDETSLAASSDAFELLHRMVEIRLRRGHLTVIDATNVQKESRASLIALARRFHVQTVAIVFDLPEAVCQARNALRPNRQFGPHVVKNHQRQLRNSLRFLEKEGFRKIQVLRTEEEVARAQIERVPLRCNLKSELGPFDIIGDVHGCGEELKELLGKLGYVADEAEVFRHHEGRKAIFVGDLADRGPQVAEVFEIAMNMAAAGQAFVVPGNHDDKLKRYLDGRGVQVKHGLQTSLDSLAERPKEFSQQVRDWIDGLPSHLIFDGGRLVVAHAGIPEEMQGRTSGAVRAICMYGETTGETDEYGLPERIEWAQSYRGSATVVFGHTPVPEALWLNGTVNIDTGCCFGGELTALRWPEKELVSVPAKAVYAEPARPLKPVEREGEVVLNLGDFTGKRVVSTRLAGNIGIREGNGTAALEVLTRFAADPKWLIYLPPTMSPSPTSQREGYLEHPEEAFADYATQGVTRVVCQEKHMGSRAVAVICRDPSVAEKRFGAKDGETGIILTRTGRKFFEDNSLESVLLERLASAVGAADLWEELNTEWVCLDCEIMPWSAKAKELLKSQYAPVAAAGTAGLAAACDALAKAQERGIDTGELLARTAERKALVEAYTAAYGRYCWDVAGPSDYRIAPFHLLAAEGQVFADKPHSWHMERLTRLAHHEPLCVATQNITVDLEDAVSREAGVSWWETLTSSGGEGMVVKPESFVTKGAGRSVGHLAQPAVKVRGMEYLRIIYGPEYTLPENLARLRSRSLTAKRSLALREFVLGIEGLERFVAREPLRKVHECVLGVLALESEPVDARL